MVIFSYTLVCLQFQMNIFTSEQPISKIDHFSAVSSLISFISLSLIKGNLNSIGGWAIVNNCKITLPHK